MGVLHFRSGNIIREKEFVERKGWEEVLLQTRLKATLSLRSTNRKSTLINLRAASCSVLDGSEGNGLLGKVKCLPFWRVRIIKPKVGKAASDRLGKQAGERRLMPVWPGVGGRSPEEPPSPSAHRPL